eukprot:2112858-Rhodomonas_salina.1
MAHARPDWCSGKGGALICSHIPCVSLSVSLSRSRCQSLALALALAVGVGVCVAGPMGHVAGAGRRPHRC